MYSTDWHSPLEFLDYINTDLDFIEKLEELIRKFSQDVWGIKPGVSLRGVIEKIDSTSISGYIGSTELWIFYDLDNQRLFVTFEHSGNSLKIYARLVSGQFTFKYYEACGVPTDIIQMLQELLYDWTRNQHTRFYHDEDVADYWLNHLQVF